jgi:hypothetical protein
MITPLPLANVLLVLTSTFVAISWAIGSAFLFFYSVISLFLAGQLVGAAKKARR